MQSELPAMSVGLHSCPDDRDYIYDSCRCAANTTVISSDHPFDISELARSRPDHRGIDDGKFDGRSFVEHFGEVSLTSLSRVHRRSHHPGRSQWRFDSRSGRGESPIDAGAFECGAMLESESSISSASSVSPGSLPQQPPGNSPLANHAISNLELLTTHHHHQQQQQQQQHLQLSGGMNTQQVANHHNNINHHQQQNNHNHHQAPYQRGPKRRAVDNEPLDVAVSGNRKERRRTQSINTAFAELRECIPNVPADTKLSKIKTLRLATSYIAYLTDMVSRDDNMNGEHLESIGGMVVDGMGDVAMPVIRQDFSLTCRSIIKESIKHESNTRKDCEVKRKRNRTGWPEHVWALELQN